ncbi:uncharacterized protein EV420DRAFT_183055 [Desarmillaria tabescens]|uniref:SEC7 domain-containing protein n=1 Tax=Armillaria tabescens TaxID=1929756 RepID=A0AA39N8W2_ARMTA|nr:uncharacterized protein EV420DRAFT_183055 [Desarmillaria tabescens]KAK0461164.1 hypothetical protein EV420DRAFT_183055 [Desarmillaria tabescens]
MENENAAVPDPREQRKLAVAKLKRAASLPRMEGGRRPRMHTEAVSEGEKVQDSRDQTPDIDTPPPEVIEPEAPPVEVDAQIQEPPVEENIETEEAEEVTAARPSSRSGRRSRSRRRSSRGSKDLKAMKARNMQTPTPTHGDSSPELGTIGLSPVDAPAIPPSPIPFASPLLRTRLLRSPTPNDRPSAPPTPLLPSLEDIQRRGLQQLQRSHSAIGRQTAMHKLTGGTDVYDPSLSPSPTPPPLSAKLRRNLTVTGDERLTNERTLVRKQLLDVLAPRFTKEADAEAISGEDRSAATPSPTSKRRRRRKRSSTNTPVPNAGVSDSEYLTTSTNTPIPPPTPLPPTLPPTPLPQTPQPHLDILPDVRARSTTPNHFPSSSASPEQTRTSPLLALEEEPRTEQDRPEPARRRSVVVEEEEDERSPMLFQYPGLPPSPPERTPINGSPLRVPHSSDVPSTVSTESAHTGVAGVPVYLSHRTPSKRDTFTSSPYPTPSQDRVRREDDEEEVLYPADTYRLRVPYDDGYGREISWIASPVPEIRMPIDDDDDDIDREEDDELDFEDRPPSRTSVPILQQDAYDSSPRASSDSQNVVIESETSPDTTPSQAPPSPPSSMAALSTSLTRASDESISAQAFPLRLSVASPVQGERSPLSTDFMDLDDRIVGTDASKRSGGDSASTSTWEKIKSFTRSGSSSGRRSRTNSLGARERRDHTDSSISRESGASLNSGRLDKHDGSTFALQQSQVMQSPPASASVPLLTGPSVSPVPLASGLDYPQYQSSKLFPFPGMRKLEEQRRAKGRISGSSSTPDVSILGSGVEEEQVPMSAKSLNALQGGELNVDHRIGHQTSDTAMRYRYLNPPPIASSSSQQDYINIPSAGSSTSKLPMTLPAVRKWLNTKRSKFSSPSSPPGDGASKKASFSDLLRIRKDNEIGTDHEESLTSVTTSTLVGKPSPTLPAASASPREVSSSSPSPRMGDAESEETPKAKKVVPASETSDELSPISPPVLSHSSSNIISSPPDPLSPTPDPSSSLSEYPAHSISSTSSISSSHYSSADASGPQGPIVLEQLDENLARGSRSPMWAAAIEEPARKLLISSPVLQVVNANTVKDRFLFLFNDILVIAKPVIQDEDIDRPTVDKTFTVKSVVMLQQLRFSGDRTETQSKSGYAVPPRNPILRTFIHQFNKDPDQAIANLFSKSGIPDDPVFLGQLLFRTMELDRKQLGEYLSRRTSKFVLKSFLDSFGFVGLRLDRALRAFLFSINVASRSGLDYLADAFAIRWYEANAAIVAYDRDLAQSFVRAIIQMNDIVHGGISQEPCPTGPSRQQVSCREFIEAFRRVDIRCLVSDEVLRQVFDATMREHLSMARPSGSLDSTINIKRPLPARLTYRRQSEPVVLRLPQADPNLSLHLYGEGLVFDPPVLTFARSSEASFRITGVSLGPKTMLMCRSGANALRYSGLPLSNTVIVERAFMRNTFQVAFRNHHGLKRRYMFSVDDPVIKHQWVAELRRRCDDASSTQTSGTGTFHWATEVMAFRVLQETLVGPAAGPVAKIHKAMEKLSGTRKTKLDSMHVRSKSRSQVYHRHGAGRNELDLSSGQISTDPTEGDISGDDHPVWTGRDLEMQCLQNSSIALVLSYLQVGAPAPGVS